MRFGRREGDISETGGSVAFAGPSCNGMVAQASQQRGELGIEPSTLPIKDAALAEKHSPGVASECPAGSRAPSH